MKKVFSLVGSLLVAGGLVAASYSGVLSTIPTNFEKAADSSSSVLQKSLEESSETTDEQELVTLKAWNFRDASQFAVDTRVTVASLTIEYDTVPGNIMLYQSTDAQWDGLVFEPAKNDGTQSWWLRNRNGKADYGLACINQTRYFAVTDLHVGYQVTIESSAAMSLADSTMIASAVKNETTTSGYGVSYTYTMAKEGFLAFLNSGVYMHSITIDAPIQTRYTSLNLNFRDASQFAVDTRVTVASLTIEYDTVPGNIMLYQSTDAQWDGLVFEPAKNDGTQSWWLRNRNGKADYGLACINQTRYFAVTDLKAGSKVTIESSAAMPLADSTMIASAVKNETTASGYGVSYTYTISKDGFLAFQNSGVYMHSILVESPVFYYESNEKNFRDASQFAVDTRVTVASLTIEYDTVPGNIMLYQSTDAQWDGLVFEPAKNDGTQSWWLRNRNGKADYGLACINQSRYFAVTDLKAGEKVLIESSAAMPLADSTMIASAVKNETTASGYGVGYTYTMAKDGFLAFLNSGVYMHRIVTTTFGGLDEGVAQPSIVAEGEDYAAKLITIECATAGAEIKYTLNGGEEQTYTEPFYLSSSALLAATATLNGVSSSTAYLDVTAGEVGTPSVKVIEVNDLERTVVIASSTASAVLNVNENEVSNNDTLKISETTEYKVFAVYADEHVGNIYSDTLTTTIEAGVMVSCAGVTYSKAIDPDSLTAVQKAEAQLYYFVVKADQSSVLCTPTVQIQYTLTPLGGETGEVVTVNPGDTIKDIPASTKLSAVAVAEGYDNSASTYIWVKKPAELTEVWYQNFDSLAYYNQELNTNYGVTLDNVAFDSYYRGTYTAAGDMTDPHIGFASNISLLLRNQANGKAANSGLYSNTSGTRTIAFNDVSAKQILILNMHNGGSESTSVSPTANLELDAANSTGNEYYYTVTGSGVATIAYPRYWYLHSAGVYNSSEVTANPVVKIAKVDSLRRWVGISTITEYADIYYTTLNMQYDSVKVMKIDTTVVSETELKFDTTYTLSVDSSLVAGEYQLYTEPFEITEETTIQAYANCMDVLSDVVTTTVEMDNQIIRLNRPVITWAEKTATFTASVDNSDVMAAPTAELYYTLAGGEESLVEGEITVPAANYGWMKVIAKASGYADSEIAWRYADGRASYTEPYMALYNAYDTIPANIAKVGDVEIKAGLCLDSIPNAFTPAGRLFFHVPTNEYFGNLVSPFLMSNSDLESGAVAVLDGNGNTLTRNKDYTVFNMVAGTAGTPASGTFAKNALACDTLLESDTLVRAGNINAKGNFLFEVAEEIAGKDLILQSKAAQVMSKGNITITQPTAEGSWKLLANAALDSAKADFDFYVLNAKGTKFVKARAVAPWQTAILLDAASTEAITEFQLVDFTYKYTPLFPSADTVVYTTATTMAEACEAGWACGNNTEDHDAFTSANKGYTINPETDETISSTKIDGVMVKDPSNTAKGLHHYVTGIKSLKAYAVNSGSSDSRYFVVNVYEAGSTTVVATNKTLAAGKATVSVAIEDLDPNKVYEVSFEGWKEDLSAGGDMMVYAVKYIRGEVSGIEHVEVKPAFEAGVIYDLQGRKVQNIQKGQIYIINGRRFLTK